MIVEVARNSSGAQIEVAKHPVLLMKYQIGHGPRVTDRAAIQGERMFLVEMPVRHPMARVVATRADNRERMFLGTLLVCPVRHPAILRTPIRWTRVARRGPVPAPHVDARVTVALRPLPRLPTIEQGHHQKHPATKEDRTLVPSSNGSETF